MSGAKREESGRIRGLLGLARRARALTIGSRDTRSALRKGRIHLVVLAGDGSPRDRERIERIAAEEGVPVRSVATRDELGAWIGFGAVSVLGLTDRRLAETVRRGRDETQDAAASESPGTGGRPDRGAPGGQGTR
jgi:ribosomal protein L7Ae-like RNA K-turn-binding protein